MCTLSILRTSAATIITMNRDERRERHETGELVDSGGVVYPQDSVSGGTWIGMNGQGTVLAILNRYQAEHHKGRASRGEIIPVALEQPSPVMWLTELDPAPYNPFDLFCVNTDQLWHFQWSGEDSESGYQMTELNAGEGFMFSSSSFNTEEVLDYREDLFREWQSEVKGYDDSSTLASKVLNDFHRRQDAGCAESAVLMEREWSHTKSIVQVQLGSEKAELAYYPKIKEPGFNGSEILKRYCY